VNVRIIIGHAASALIAIMLMACDRPDGYAMSVCKVNAVWFEGQHLQAECGSRNIKDNAKSTSVGFDRMTKCINAPASILGGATYAIAFDYASDAYTCFNVPTIAVGGTNADGEQDTVHDDDFPACLETGSGEMTFVADGDYADPYIRITTGDWCSSVRITDIVETFTE